MFGISLKEIELIIQQYGYISIFPASIIEGPVIAVLAGFIASLGKLNIFLVFLILLAGDVVGDTLYYSIGLFGRKTFIVRWGKFIGITENKITTLESYFKKHKWKILAFGKTQPIGSAVLVTAGIARMPYLHFIFYNTLFSLPKIFILELIGFYFGDAYYKINSYLGYAGLWSFVLGIFLILGYLRFKQYLISKNPELHI